MLASMPGIVQDADGEMHFTDWNCRAGQNNVIIRTDGTVAPCFPMYASTYDWGNIDRPISREAALKMKNTASATASPRSTTTWPTATTMHA